MNKEFLKDCIRFKFKALEDIAAWLPGEAGKGLRQFKAELLAALGEFLQEEKQTGPKKDGGVRPVPVD